MSAGNTAHWTAMRLEACGLRQRDGLTCGPAVAVVAGVLMDPARGAALLDPATRTVSGPGRLWFAAEQGRVHAEVNRLWPRRLGTTPAGMARALTAQAAVGAQAAVTAQAAGPGVRYRWRVCRGRWDGLADVVAALDRGCPVALLIGGVLPRHWVLLVGRDAAGDLRCYEPSSGIVVVVPAAALRTARLTGLGFPRAFVVVRPVHR